MFNPLKRALALAAVVAMGPAMAQITLYEHDNFGGRTFTADNSVDNLRDFGFNDRASSVVVEGRRWQICDDARFGGRCVELRPGRYTSLSEMGMNDRVSSVRMIGYEGRADQRSANDWRQDDIRADEHRHAEQNLPDPSYRRRDGERLYEAKVTSVRAVVGPTEKRCWMEQEQVNVPTPERRNNVGGAVLGAVLGGIIGHQVGGGTGRDIATIGGAVAGGAIGNRVGRNDGPQTRTQDVQRCRDVPSANRPADATHAAYTPNYWDVGYNFRGVNHKVQMTMQPGATITVNRQGEPRT